jgi:hypothetical protein
VVFPRRSLGLGRIPGYFGGRKRSEVKEEYREHQGATAPVTVDEVDDGEAGPVVA